MKRKSLTLTVLGVLGLSTAAFASPQTSRLATANVPTFSPISVSSVDTNGDGMLSASELRVAFKAMRTHRKTVRKAKRANHIAQYDSNGDGKLDKSERTAAKAARTAARAERLAKLDTNSDGSLSAAEVEGTRIAKRFTKLDADGNGLISKTEMAKAKKARKGKRGKKARKGKRAKGAKGKANRAERKANRAKRQRMKKAKKAWKIGSGANVEAK